MASQINLQKENHFVVDYRSCPSGIGTIFFSEEQGFKKSLVTDMDCGPKDIAEARETMNPDYLPDYVDYIPLDNEFWKIKEQCLGAILATHRVSYVVDSELAHEHPELTDSDGGQNTWIFTIQNWLKARDIKGIL